MISASSSEQRSSGPSPNGLPESVRDRVRRSHEQWFHFVKQPRYFSAVDEIREPHQHHRRDAWDRRDTAERSWGIDVNQRAGNNHLGKLPGSVWEIPSEPLKVPEHLGVDHFAAFPSEWPRRLILGWSPSGICQECGEGRRPVVDREYVSAGGRGDNERYARITQGHGDIDMGRFKPQEMTHGRANMSATITGYTCACSEPTADIKPSVILDPFGGTGTVAMVARALGRVGISIDLSTDYCRLAQWRVFHDDKKIAKVLQRTYG